MGGPLRQHRVGGGGFQWRLGRHWKKENPVVTVRTGAAASLAYLKSTDVQLEIELYY